MSVRACMFYHYENFQEDLKDHLTLDDLKCLKNTLEKFVRAEILYHPLFGRNLELKYIAKIKNSEYQIFLLYETMRKLEPLQPIFC